MVHSGLHLKIKCSKAVCHYSLSLTFSLKTPKTKPSSIRLHRSIIFYEYGQFNTADSTTRLFLSSATNLNGSECDYPFGSGETRVAKPHSPSILYTKKIDRPPRHSSPLIVTKNTPSSRPLKKERSKEITKIAGWKNNREADMEDGEVGVRGGRFEECLCFWFVQIVFTFFYLR